MKKLKTPIELKGRVIQYKTIVHLKKVQKSMKGGESEALKAILEIAKRQFFEENKFNANNKSTILGIMQSSLPDHKSASHTPIEDNWKDGAIVIQQIRDVNGKLSAKLYETTMHLKKSATSKTIREILNGLLDESIQITFTWSPNFNLVFVNFYSTISDPSKIEHVNHVYEPCTEDGHPIEEAPPYSYYHSSYIKLSGIPPYQIISREFTNQIYGWLGKYGTLENFKPKYDTLTDESELPLRFLYV
jgi:hypothetical protein